MLGLHRQIEGSIRRTATKGYISLLNKKELEYLAIKYFGKIDNDGNFEYTCPYTGKIIRDKKELVLDHIIPVYLNGGTVLFNCIPISYEVNSSNEKGAKHLLSWWTKSKYWDENAPKRLETLLKYILEGYKITFEKTNIEDLIYSYKNFKFKKTYNDNDNKNLFTTQEEEQEILKSQAKHYGLITYYQFLNDIIVELKRYNIDTSKYEEEIKQMMRQGIFKNIDEISNFQLILKKVIKSKFEYDDRRELDIILNININKLQKSIKEKSMYKVYNELLKRINNIETILTKHNIGIQSYLLNIKNTDILYKEIDEITETDIEKLINEINLCVDDRFRNLIIFVQQNGYLPSTSSKDKAESSLGHFKGNIKNPINNKKFGTPLRKEQLKYLHDSNIECLKNLYKVILYKAIENDIKIDYIDEAMANRIKEYLNKLETASIDDKVTITNEYSDIIIYDKRFCEFINFANSHNGMLPSKYSKDDNEKEIAYFRYNILAIKKKGTFQKTLTAEELQYLHDSKFESLRELYKIVLNKAIENDIKIDYIDEAMANRIKEFQVKFNKANIDTRIKLLQEYEDVAVINNQFYDLILFVKKHNGQSPSNHSKNEKEQMIGYYKIAIHKVNKNGLFNTTLTKEELQYLHDSEFEVLRELYKKVLSKSIKNNIKIAYVDKIMSLKIEEYERRNINLGIEEQIELIKEYRDFIVVDNQFYKFIDYVNQNNGLLPSTTGNTEEERTLGRFRNSIQVFKRNNTFNTNLTKEELQYMYNSKYETLRNLYKAIMEKAYIVNYKQYIEYDIEINSEAKNRKEK